MQYASKPVVGIIGDGQLALMLAEVLIKKDQDFLCLSHSPDSPIKKIFPKHITSDEKSFAYLCSSFTLENEFFSCPELASLLKEKVSALFPDIRSYKNFQGKIEQRIFYDSLNIPSPKWMALRHKLEIPHCLESFKYPFVMKASKGGYDGRGVKIICDKTDFDNGLEEFNFSSNEEILIEQKIPIFMELAQGFLKNKQDHFSLLPLVHTVQEKNVCNMVLYPAQVSESVSMQVKSILDKLLKSELIGIFNFEFFVDVNEKVYINEGAPRPHNSQHLTIEASNYSQFELLAMYLCHEQPLPETVRTKTSALVNVLGLTSTDNHQLILPHISEPVMIKTKLYGKRNCSPGRKMGHVTIIDEEGKSNLGAIARKIIKEYTL